VRGFGVRRLGADRQTWRVAGRCQAGGADAVPADALSYASFKSRSCPLCCCIWTATKRRAADEEESTASTAGPLLLASAMRNRAALRIRKGQFSDTQPMRIRAVVLKVPGLAWLVNRRLCGLSFDSIRREVRGRHSPVGWGRAGLADDRPGVLVTLPGKCVPLDPDREKGWPKVLAFSLQPHGHPRSTDAA